MPARRAQVAKVSQIVDSPQRLNARRLLGGSPLKRAEVVDVEVAATLAGKEKQRAVVRHDAVERIEGTSLQWHGSRARLGFQHLQLSARVRAANEDETLLAVDVAFLKGYPLRRAEARLPLQTGSSARTAVRSPRRALPAPSMTRTDAAPCAAAPGFRRRLWLG